MYESCMPSRRLRRLDTPLILAIGCGFSETDCNQITKESLLKVRALDLNSMVLSVGSVLRGAFTVCKEVHSRLESLAENNELSDRIQRHIQNLETTATELKNLKQDELPESCTDNITSFNDSLGLCKAACADLRNAAKIKKYISVHVHKKELETLDTQLRRAFENLQLVLHQVSLFQTRKLKEAIESGIQDIIRTVVHPQGPVFLPNRIAQPKPQEIKSPQVSLDEFDLMDVKWIDDNNPNDAVDSYEIRYDEKNEQVISAQRDKCIYILAEGSNTFGLKLGYPKIKPGNIYTIQVRAVNGAGPGKWSEPPVIFRFKSGPPNKPRKPAVTVLSPTEVQITVSRLSEREENGSCITQCKVEYTEKIDGDDPTWSILQVPIKKRTTLEVKFKMVSLKPDAAYSFRVRMINDSGESIPSDSCDVITSQLIPGPPQNLRISSKRTSPVTPQHGEDIPTSPVRIKDRLTSPVTPQHGEYRPTSPVTPQYGEGCFSLKSICSELGVVTYKWYQIGVQLGIPYHKLKEFEEERDPLVATIHYWLNGNVEGVSISWSSIVTALKSSHVGESGLANKMKKKYK